MRASISSTFLQTTQKPFSNANLTDAGETKLLCNVCFLAFGEPPSLAGGGERQRLAAGYLSTYILLAAGADTLLVKRCPIARYYSQKAGFLSDSINSTVAVFGRAAVASTTHKMLQSHFSLLLPFVFAVRSHRSEHCSLLSAHRHSRSLGGSLS